MEKELEELLKTATASVAATDEVKGPALASDIPQVKDLSAAAVGRMLGLATQSDVRLVEQKIDFIGTKLTTIAVKLEKLATQTAQIPTGNDLERIDIQIGGLRNLIKETLTGKGGNTEATSGASAASTGGPKIPPPPARPKASVFVKEKDAASTEAAPEAAAAAPETK